MQNVPTDLGLVISLGGFATMESFEGPENQHRAIRVHLETLGGKHYFLSLTASAAHSMVLGLSNWQPVQDFLSGEAPAEPPKRQ
jgi:hypothetical protein